MGIFHGYVSLPEGNDDFANCQWWNFFGVFNHQPDDLGLYPYSWMWNHHESPWYIICIDNIKETQVHLQVYKPMNIEFSSDICVWFWQSRNCFVNCLPTKSGSGWSRIWVATTAFNKKMEWSAAKTHSAKGLFFDFMVVCFCVCSSILYLGTLMPRLSKGHVPQNGLISSTIQFSVDVSEKWLALVRHEV